MKVEILKSMRGPGVNWKRGHIVEVSEESAKFMAAKGHARILPDAPKAEADDSTTSRRTPRKKA